VRRTAIALAVLIGAAAPRSIAAADTYGLAVPRGTRVIEGDRYTSGKGLRDTVDFYRKQLDKLGLSFRRIGPYRVRGVDVARFVIDTGDVAAVHVYRVEGKTLISFVKRARS
jgi:hypothetical protein